MGIEEQATVLGSSGNYAVVKLEGRKFGGVLLPGDSLSVLRDSARELTTVLASADPDMEEATLLAQDVLSTLTDMLSVYEAVCAEKGLKLPYFPGGPSS